MNLIGKQVLTVEKNYFDEIHKRYQYLRHNPDKCPACGETLQIQLISYHCDHPEWKCRKCKHRFTGDKFDR